MVGFSSMQSLSAQNGLVCAPIPRTRIKQVTFAQTRDSCGIGPISNPNVPLWQACDDVLLPSLLGCLAQPVHDVWTSALMAEVQCVIDWLLMSQTNFQAASPPPASRMTRAVSAGWSQCGKWPLRSNQCSCADGKAA